MPSRTNEIELRFFSSTLVPSLLSPTGRMEMFASQRIWPFSMSQSEIPPCTMIVRNTVRKANASSALRNTGSVTISMSGRAGAVVVDE